MNNVVDEKTDHIIAIEKAILTSNVHKLRKLALKGFVNNDLRRQAWPLLLDCMIENDSERRKEDVEHKMNNDYYDQIEKDVHRSMNHFDVNKDYSSLERTHDQQILQRMLNAVFYYNKDLHYTQGFHDMCSVFYIVCGERLGTVLSESLAKRHMRDLTRDNLNVFQWVLDLILPLLSLCDHEMHLFLTNANVTAFFALSWILTWFAHNITQFEDIARIYDYFLSSHPIKPLYMTVTLMLHCREDLLSITDVDQAGIHKFFQEFQWNIDFNVIIDKCEQIFCSHPPHQLYQLSMEKLSKLPKDSPFLAQDINEIENLKENYSGWYLAHSIWHYRNPRFWSHFMFPISLSVLLGYLLLTIDKGSVTSNFAIKF